MKHFLPWCCCLSLPLLRNSTLYLDPSIPNKSCCCLTISSSTRELFFWKMPEDDKHIHNAASVKKDTLWQTEDLAHTFFLFCPRFLFLWTSYSFQEQLQWKETHFRSFSDLKITFFWPPVCVYVQELKLSACRREKNHTASRA